MQRLTSAVSTITPIVIPLSFVPSDGHPHTTVNGNRQAGSPVASPDGVFVSQFFSLTLCHIACYISDQPYPIHHHRCAFMVIWLSQTETTPTNLFAHLWPGEVSDKAVMNIVNLRL